MTKPDITPEAVERLAKLLDEDADAQNSQPCEMTGLLPDDERDAAATLRAQAERIAEFEAALDNTDGMGLWRFWSQKSLQLAERTKELEAERDAFRAVLEGAGYSDIDGIGKQDPELNRLLGLEVARLTQLEGPKARNDALREAKAKILTSYQGPRTGGTVAWVLGQIDALIEGDN